MTLPAAGPGVLLVDTGHVRDHLVASYIVLGKRGAAVVETGSALTVPRLLAALAEAGVSPGDVSHVIVTHVHLDHAGGAGALLAKLPRATLVAHPRGARHLVDPSRLVAGTVAVYGEAYFREVYGEVVPAPAARVVEAPDGFVLDLGGRPLRFLDAPGHARHHLVVVDEASRGVFTGDAFGLAYPQFAAPGRPFLFPTTTPVQFDPPALHATVDRILRARPARLYLTHYGAIEAGLAEAAAALHRAIDAHVEIARRAPAGPGRHAAILQGLEALLLRLLEAHGSPASREAALAWFAGDLELNAQGLGVWLDSAPEA
jgi:glyoxylase-like metal-dependent hydrolase (beta-lactamase superfamily II)